MRGRDDYEPSSRGGLSGSGGSSGSGLGSGGSGLHAGGGYSDGEVYAQGGNFMREYWNKPDSRNEAAATAHLTFEGTRDQYIGGIPDDLARKIPSSVWEE